MSTIRVTNIQAIGASDPALVISGASVIFNSGLVIESGITIGTDAGTSGQFIMSQGPGEPVVYSTPVADIGDDIEVVTITATGNQNTFVSGFDLVQATTGDFLEITAFEESNGFIRTFSGDFHDLVVGATGIFGAFTDNPTLRVQGNSICESGVFFVDDAETAALKLYASSTSTNGPNIVIGATGIADGSTNRSNIAIGFNALANLENARSSNLAIGTNALRDTTAGANNVALGVNAGQNVRPAGNAGGNTFVGVNAGQGNGDTNNNTQDCTFVGNQAGISVLQGRDHVAIGKEAMRQHQTALESGNVCVGANAFRDAQEGELNTVIGHHAAEDSTGGDENVFVGAFSGQNNTASGNVAIGANALQANTSGETNTAVGGRALEDNIGGTNNTAVGVSALQNNTSASNNTAIGRSALRDNIEGVSNTALGVNALLANTSGDNNICVGFEAGRSLTNGDNNTIIGRIDGTAGMANTVILGAGATERLRITETQLQYPSAGTTTVTFTSGGRGEFEDGVEASDGSSLRLENSAEDQVIAINASGTTAGYTLEMPRSSPSANAQVLTVSGGGGSTNVQLEWADAGGGDIPQGTVMLFFQASAPTGFTQVTTQNNKALRVVSGTGGGTGGDTSFTDIFGSSATLDLTGSVGDTTLTTSQIPSHSHTQVNNEGTQIFTRMQSASSSGSQNTGSTGGGQSHTHSLTSASVSVDMDLEFIDILLASKD